MERETFKFTENLRCLVYEDDVYSDETDEWLYEFIDKEILYVDLEKCYKNLKIICRRVVDNKYFSFKYCYSYNWKDDSDIEVKEVFPKTRTIIVYE